MTRKPAPDTHTDDPAARSDESFLQRFHRRKSEARQTTATVSSASTTDAADASAAALNGIDSAPMDEATPDPRNELTDADMPPLESLTADSDYSGFLSAKVSEDLRRAALRKLFHSPQFNVICELDDYAEDFTRHVPLGSIVTSDMRHQLEVAARKQAERLQQALVNDCDSHNETIDSAVSDGAQPPAATVTLMDQTDTLPPDEPSENDDRPA